MLFFNVHFLYVRIYSSFLQVIDNHAKMAFLTRRINHFQDKRDKQMIVGLVIITIFFILCNSFEPIIFIVTYQNWLTQTDIFVNYLRPTANFLLVLYSSVNTLFYGTCSTSFREKFKDIIL